MSVLSDFYTTSYTLYKPDRASATSTSGMSVVGTGVCLIRPIVNANQLLDQSNYGTEFKMFCDETFAFKTSYLVVAASSTYSVASKTDLVDLEDDSESHYEIRLYKKN